MDAEEHFPSAGPEHERDEYSDEEAEAGAVPVSSHRHSGGSPPRHGSPKHHAKATPGEASLELLFRSGQSNHIRPRRGETAEDFLARVTHLTITKKRLTHLSKHLKLCTEMRVLYAYDNRLVRMEHLEACTRLTHVYLQNNQLTDLSGLGSIKNLAKLYVDNNAIARVEGLEGLMHLEELHISDQRLPEGTSLEFTRNSMLALSRSLRVLSASRCGIADVTPLAVLRELRIASLGGNRLEHESVEGLEAVLGQLPMLTSLDLTDNPICHIQKYRDNIILMSQNLEELDGKPITGTERQFLLQLHIRKLKREQAAERREAKLAAAAEAHRQAQVASVFPASVPMPNPVNLDHMAPPDIGSPGFLQRVPSGDARPAPGSHSGSDAPSGTPPPGQAGGHGLSLAGVNLS